MTTIILLTILVVTGVIARNIHINSVCDKYANVIYPGVKIQDIDLSGKTKQQAINLLTQKYGDTVLKKNILINTPKKKYAINYSKLNARYNINEIVNKAFSYGKDKEVKEKYNLIKKPKPQNFELKFNYDGKYIETLIKQMEKDINKNPLNASVSKAQVESEQFKVTSGKNGQALNSEKLKKDITSVINGELGGDAKVTAEIKVVEPKATTEELKKLNKKIVTFSTGYKTSSYERSTNIELATKAINGVLLMPGDTFSFNEIVGQRTEQRGYKNAHVIIGTKVVDGIGGGICQVSSTLYNAVLRANMSSVQRMHHTFPSSYVNKGADATVSYPAPDYKFKNTLKYPVYIEAYAKDKTIICNVYSNSSLSNIKYDIISDVYETVQPKTNYVYDSSLPKGQQVIDTPAKVGYRVKVYRVASQNGKEISRKLLYKDYYKPVNGVIRKGTK
ncbi:VanW family protein [Haloimpatiens sp. FM7330]|uniref:VanW family protein n=1 Tax=Haloimpatiens sp. FM7330 TaxID=3298610 RepID=UPI003641F9C8